MHTFVGWFACALLWASAAVAAEGFKSCAMVGVSSVCLIYINVFNGMILLSDASHTLRKSCEPAWPCVRTTGPSCVALVMQSCQGPFRVLASCNISDTTCLVIRTPDQLEEGGPGGFPVQFMCAELPPKPYKNLLHS